MSGGERLFELNVLLRHAVMIRRMKKDVVGDLPPKRRQVVLIDCEGLDGKRAGGAGKKTHGASQEEEEEEEEEDELDELDVIEPLAPDEERRSGSGAGRRTRAADAAPPPGGEAKKSKAQAGRAAKTRRVLRLAPRAPRAATRRERERERGRGRRRGGGARPRRHLRASQGSPRRDSARGARFPSAWVPATGADAAAAGAHARFLPSFVRIDGLDPERGARRGGGSVQGRRAVRRGAHLHQSRRGPGWSFKKASVVVFAELPESAADVEQAEDRVHRRGQKGSGERVLLSRARVRAREDRRRAVELDREEF